VAAAGSGRKENKKGNVLNHIAQAERSRGMVRRGKQLVLIGLFCLFFSDAACAFDLRGYFPLYAGRFWNFTGAPDGAAVTWAVNGTLTLKDIGRVALLAQDDGGFLCLREEWDGIHLYGEFHPDVYFIPEKPLLFLPSTLKPEQPLEQQVTLRKFSDPEGNINFKETGKVNRTVKFVHKEFEDVTIAGRVFKNCAVVEKTTREQDTVTVETLYLAPVVGPVKRIISNGKENVVYSISTFAGSGSRAADNFPVKALPFKPGIIWAYKDQKGAEWRTTTKPEETIEGTKTLPFAEDTGDIYYFTLDKRGLLLTRKYWVMVGGCTDFHPPEPPLVFFPAVFQTGSYYSSISSASVHTWPSMTLMEDFYTEMHCSSIAVLREDVTVPAGKYRDCLKVCQFILSRNFNMNNEQLRIGYLWLAKDAGVVREKLVDMTNYFNPQRINRVTSIRFRDLIKIDKKGK
jgi:hypothetical protein